MEYRGPRQRREREERKANRGVTQPCQGERTADLAAGARLPSPVCLRLRLRWGERQSRQSAAEALQGVPIRRTAHDPYKAAAPPLPHRP